jgi:transcriptional regulator with XRE-family HTH domain
MDFPSRVRRLRKEHKLTQEELGKKLNVTKVSISGYENGNRTPDSDTLNLIADVFDVTTDYLYGRSDDPRLTAKEDKEVDKQVEELLKNLESVPEHRREELIRMTKNYIKTIEEEEN